MGALKLVKLSLDGRHLRGNPESMRSLIFLRKKRNIAIVVFPNFFDIASPKQRTVFFLLCFCAFIVLYADSAHLSSSILTSKYFLPQMFAIFPLIKGFS